MLFLLTSCYFIYFSHVIDDFNSSYGETIISNMNQLLYEHNKSIALYAGD